MADILSYLLRLSDVCGVDLEQALLEKTELNETRYPVELAKGSAQKYTQLGGSDS
jgi:dCTP diphosphatase